MDTNYLTELANLTRISWVLLIPVALLLCVVMYQVAVLLSTTVDLLKLVKYESAPMLQDMKQITNHVESITASANNSVAAVEKTAHAVGPWVQNKVNQSSNTAKSGFSDAIGLAKAAAVGLTKSLKRSNS